MGVRLDCLAHPMPTIRILLLNFLDPSLFAAAELWA